VNECNFILCLFFLYRGLSCEQTVCFVWIYVRWMCLFIEYLKCTMKICGCQWHMFAIVQWLNSLWRRNSSSAVTFVYISATRIRRWGMWNRYVFEELTWICQNMMHVANRVTYFVANDESFNEEMKWLLGVACYTVSKQESWNCIVGQQGNGSM